MATLQKVVSGAPPAERTRALVRWPAYEESGQSCSRLRVCSLGRRSGPSRNVCKLVATRSGSRGRLWSMPVVAKAVRQRHKEIDKSEKLMEDPYGHVCDVMSRNVVTVNCEELACIKDAGNSVAWSMDMDVFEHYTGLPVVDSGGKCVGVLTAADYENRAGNCRSDEWRPVADGGASREVDSSAVPPLVGLPVSAIMSSPAIVIKEHAPIAYAAALMLQNKVHRLPVADTDGALVGIITRTDIFEPVSEVNPVYHALVGKHRDAVPEFTDE